MKYIIICFFLFGCNEVVEVKKEADSYIEHPTTDITFNDSDRYNGQIDYINDNSWVFTSHTNPLCVNGLNHHCRKVNALYDDEVASDRVIKLAFEFMVADINLLSDLYWDIIYQDWVRIFPNDSNGNHPITTLKLKIFDGVLNLCHYENSWQWGYDYGNNIDGDKIDVDHTLHQENTLHGCKVIDVGVSYDIEIITHDEGRFIYKVNDEVISDQHYQTKSPTENHVIQWGHYWVKGFNLNNNPLHRIIVRFDNFTRYIKT